MSKKFLLVIITCILFSIHFKCSAPEVSLKKGIVDDMDKFDLLVRNYIDNESDTMSLREAMRRGTANLLSDSDKGIITIYTTTFPDSPAIYSVIHEDKFNFSKEDHLKLSLLGANGSKNIFAKGFELTKLYDVNFDVYLLNNPSSGYRYCLEAKLDKYLPIKSSSLPSKVSYGESVIILYKYYY